MRSDQAPGGTVTTGVRQTDAWLAFGLAFVGGYSDAASFVLATTFTGHVTGNLVLGAIAGCPSIRAKALSRHSCPVQCFEHRRVPHPSCLCIRYHNFRMLSRASRFGLESQILHVWDGFDLLSVSENLKRSDRLIRSPEPISAKPLAGIDLRLLCRVPLPLCPASAVSQLRGRVADPSFFALPYHN